MEVLGGCWALRRQGSFAPLVCFLSCASLPPGCFWVVSFIINQRVKCFPQFCELFYQIIKPKERVFGTPNLEQVCQIHVRPRNHYWHLKWGSLSCGTELLRLWNLALTSGSWYQRSWKSCVRKDNIRRTNPHLVSDMLHVTAQIHYKKTVVLQRVYCRLLVKG